MRWVIAACFLLPLVASGARADQINLLSPPMITNAGLKEINARYAEKSRNSLAVDGAEIGRLADKIKTAQPPADVIFLPTLIARPYITTPGVPADRAWRRQVRDR